MDHRDLDLRQVREGRVSEEEVERRRQLIIERLIVEGLESGEPIQVSAEFWAKRCDAMLQSFQERQ